MLYRRFILFLLVLFPLSLFAQASKYQSQLAEIDAYVEKARQDWKIPGLAMAIVKDDQVIWAKGYGVRELGKPEPVNEKTLFAIASNSKAFTTALLAILVDEGKLKWDDKVTKYWPEFELYDAYVTREMTIRDLVSHRSGLATFSGDLLWYDTNYSRAEVIRRARFIKPVTSFRSAYGYQNIMFLLAGEIAAKVAGKSWDELVKEKFFVPLGMTTTNTSVTLRKPNENWAAPHVVKHGAETNSVVRYDVIDNCGGAAVINSNVAELAQWMRLQLGRGTYNGKQFFSAAQSHQMWQPNIFNFISPAAEKFNPTRHFSAYGMGWALADYQGRKVVSHGGGMTGMISQTALMPEENLGVVILTNSETGLPGWMVSKVFDVFLGVPKRDWSAEMLARTKQGEAAAKAAEAKAEATQVKGTKPSLEQSKYVGTYSSQLYGDAKITEENGKLVLQLAPAPNFIGDLEHWHYDTFRVKWRDSVRYAFPKGYVTFTLKANGQLDEMKIDCPNPDFDFTELDFRRK